MSEWFEYPWVLLGLLALPLYGWLWYGRAARRAGPMIFSRVGLAKAVGGGPRVWGARALPALRLAALGLLVVACARPSVPLEEEAEVEGIDIYVSLDLSGSMQAIDTSDPELHRYQSQGREPPNRFDIAKEVLEEFVGSRKTDRIGMVVFARDAYLQFPLTLDYGTILTQLDQLQLGDIDGAGTAIGNALGRAVAGLREANEGEALGGKPRTKIIILITDGDRRGGNISPAEATQFAVEKGIKIYPILVGREGKARVPAGRDLFNGKMTYRFQEYPVDAALLDDIAKKTGGEFTRATDKKGLRENLHRILDSLEKAAVEDVTDVRRAQYFGPFAGLAALLLALEVLVSSLWVRPFP